MSEVLKKLRGLGTGNESSSGGEGEFEFAALSIEKKLTLSFFLGLKQSRL